MSTAVVVLVLSLTAPALLLGLALAVSAALPAHRPRLHARTPQALREPADLSAASAEVQHRAPEWAAALRS